MLLVIVIMLCGCQIFHIVKRACNRKLLWLYEKSMILCKIILIYSVVFSMGNDVGTEFFNGIVFFCLSTSREMNVFNVVSRLVHSFPLWAVFHRTGGVNLVDLINISLHLFLTDYSSTPF